MPHNYNSGKRTSQVVPTADLEKSVIAAARETRTLRVLQQLAMAPRK